MNEGRGVIEELKNDGDFFDLLILDLQMPRVDGYEVLEWMRDNNVTGRFPVLAVTGAYDSAHIFITAEEPRDGGTHHEGLKPRTGDSQGQPHPPPGHGTPGKSTGPHFNSRRLHRRKLFLYGKTPEYQCRRPLPQYDRGVTVGHQDTTHIHPPGL